MQCKLCLPRETELAAYKYIDIALSQACGDKVNTYIIDPFNVCKHRKPRLGARAAWGQKNGAANRPTYCVKEKQTSLIDR